MCELLAMSARFPTSIRSSLAVLAEHGGGTGPHRDGWGIAYTHDGDAFVVREPDAAHASRCLVFLQERDPASSLVIAHIRRATQGAPLLRNTQPFVRELGGRAHLFAHNGMLPGVEQRLSARWSRRIGDTDSEHAFCALLDRLRPLWEHGTPTVEATLDVLAPFAAELRVLGPANFLYSDGEHVFAHGDRRRHDDGTIRWPGLHVLCRTCADATGDQQVALVASVPLSAESWRAVGEGEIVVLAGGQLTRAVPSPSA